MSCIGAFQSVASSSSSSSSSSYSYSSFRSAQTNTRKSAGSRLLPLAVTRIHSQNHNIFSLAQTRKFGYGLKFRTNRGSYRCLSALTPELKTTLDKVVTSHKVILFMKGTKDFPQCGFSNTVVQILKSINVPFETMNILENEIVRQGLKEYSSWPTFPLLYIDGEFFGGCDITVEAYKSGKLQELLEKTMCS